MKMSMRQVCTTLGGLAGMLLVVLCALFTLASIDFGAIHSIDLQSRTVEWLLGSEPGGMVIPKPATPSPPGSQLAENGAESQQLVEFQDRPEEIVLEESDAPGLDEQTGSPIAESYDASYDVCLVVSVRRAVQPDRRALPYDELYRLFNAARSSQVLGFNNRTLWVGTDVPIIVCKMVRDTFGPEIECSNFHTFRVNKTKECKHLVVGETKLYAAQPSLGELRKLNLAWKTTETVGLDSEDAARVAPSIPESEWRSTIVTAFSSNHAEVGLLLLRSLGRVAAQQSEFNVSVVVWTMNNLHAVASRALSCVVEELQTVYNVPTEVRPFDFHAWPQWMRINQKLGYNGGRGEYAWKAVMIHTVLVERGWVYWADAGDRFRTVDGLTRTLRNVKLTGFASRLSSGDVRRWCHPMQLQYFRANVSRIRNLPNCDASGIGFTLHKYSELARPWYECSITRQCIAPDGSSRKNHRQDQAALTVLAALTGNNCQGVDQGIHRNLDSKPDSYMMGVEATKCYKDPLHIQWQ